MNATCCSTFYLILHWVFISALVIFSRDTEMLRWHMNLCAESIRLVAVALSTLSFVHPCLLCIPCVYAQVMFRKPLRRSSGSWIFQATIRLVKILCKLRSRFSPRFLVLSHLRTLSECQAIVQVRLYAWSILLKNFDKDEIVLIYFLPAWIMF